MTPAMLLAAAVALLVAGFAGGLKWHAGQDAIAEQARLEAIERDRRFAEHRVDTAATAHQADTARLEREFVVITERVQDATQTPFYAAGAPGCLDDNGLRQLRAAIGAAAGGEPAPAVPRPDPAQ